MIQKAPAAEIDPNVLHVENIGPVSVADIPAKPGTVVVLEAPNGAGKSTILNAVGAIANRRSAGLTSRDGTTGGYVEGFGVTIKVARGGSNRRLEGDDGCLVIGIEDRLNISDFVDPPVKDQVAADLRRIKALVQLTQASPSMDQYYALVGGRDEFVRLVPDLKVDDNDPVGTADRIKRALEAAARLYQVSAENHHSAAVAKRRENDGLDLTAPHDEQRLQADLEQAIGRDSSLRQQRQSADAAATRRNEAAQKLEALRASQMGSVEDCEARLRGSNATEASLAQRVEDCRRELQFAEQQLAHARRDRELAEAALASARQHQQTIASWEQTIAAAADVVSPTDDEIAQAAAAVQAARESLSNGVRIRDGLARESAAQQADAAAAQARKSADQLRSAAQGTMDVLSQTVKSLSPRITIDADCRLVVKGHARGDVFFGELSDGERWRLALDLATEAFKRRGERGLLAIPQEAWEGLDEHNRREVVDAVSQTDLVVFAAQASRDPEAQGIKVLVMGQSA